MGILENSPSEKFPLKSSPPETCLPMKTAPGGKFSPPLTLKTYGFFTITDAIRKQWAKFIT